jgi:predicted nucleotidyltransferase
VGDGLSGVEWLKSRMSLVSEPCVKAVLLFGSRARGESGERSDIDLLVLHEGYGIKDIVARRRHFYKLLRKSIGGGIDLTVVDMELNEFLKPRGISPLLLNIYSDAIVLYDSTGSLEVFLKDVRRRISESGLKKVRNGKAYRWILPEPLKEVRIL